MSTNQSRFRKGGSHLQVIADPSSRLFPDLKGHFAGVPKLHCVVEGKPRSEIRQVREATTNLFI